MNDLWRRSGFKPDLRLVGGQLVNTLDVSELWKAFGEGDLALWREQYVEMSALLERGSDWLVEEDTLRVTVLGALACAGTLGWDTHGWEGKARALLSAVHPLVDPFMGGFDHRKAYGLLSRAQRSLCNTSSYTKAARDHDVEKRLAISVWTVTNGYLREGEQ